ncbi:MAG: glycosyltransferase [Myxococcota bacterium]|nr:glycosyltransferase [Myxococcota bacterium]
MRDERLIAALGYRKFRGPTRVLVLDTGYLMVEDVIDAATDLGWHVATIQTQKEGMAQGSFISQLLRALIAERPDFIFTINHLGFDEKGVLAGLLNRYQIRIASWFVDHPLPILGGAMGNATPNTQVFCFEKTALRWLKTQGYEDPVYLPTGYNQRHFHPDRVNGDRAAALGGPLTFVGNSWWSKARESPDQQSKRAAQDILQQIQVNRNALAQGFAEALDAVKLDIPEPRARYTATQIALAEASMETRRQFAAALRPFGLTIYGDVHWDHLVPGIDRRPGLIAAGDVPALFAGSSLSANVSAEQMPTAVNQRVWEVPAVGGCLLTDAQEDAQVYFVDGEDIVLYQSFEEAADKAAFYLRHPEKRRAISERSFQKVSAAHRLTHRLEQMEKTLKSRVL